MFISIKNLTSIIDDSIQYYIDGMNSKSNHTEEEFNNWHTMITKTITARLEKLKQLSSNKNLISKYESKINSLFEQYE